MPVKTGNASIGDRTHEFLGIAERVRKSTAHNGPSSSGEDQQQQQPRSAVALQSEFDRRASEIGNGIHSIRQTSQKLAKLAKLAKRTSVFDDPTMEIQELTAVIKQDITALNSAVVDLQFLCNSRNDSGPVSTDTTTHSTTVVDDLKNRLMSATKEFKDVLTIRTEESESEDELLDEGDDEVEEENDHESETQEQPEPVVEKPVEASPAPKETERQLSKKERRKKELAELEAILADFGVNPKEKAEDESSDVTKVSKEGQSQSNGDADKKDEVPVESKNAKKKKKKASKEAKEPQDRPDTPDGLDEATGNEQVHDDDDRGVLATRSSLHRRGVVPRRTFMFFSRDDVVVLLVALIRFRAKGNIENINWAAIHSSSKFSQDFNKQQLKDKASRLKRDYHAKVQLGGSSVITDEHTLRVFEMSGKIWGGEETRDEEESSELQSVVGPKALDDDADEEKEALRSEVSSLRSDRDRLELHVQALSSAVANFKEQFGKYTAESEETRSVFEAQILELQNRLADAEAKILEGESLRKKLHNTILELKGNIRVFCRVRPLLSDDGVGVYTKVVSFPTSMEALGRSIDLTQNGQKHSFTFDKVFMPDACQEDVFVEISQLVQSALDGYKVCIFAYGQTGSGKTFTMIGKPDQKGLIPRSLEQVFETRQILQAQGWKYEMKVSMLEIYNETIRDLLATNRSGFDASRTPGKPYAIRRDMLATNRSGFDASRTPGKPYAIRHDANDNTFVSDLTIEDVRSREQVSDLLDREAKNRSVAKTQMNEQSSRSHFVFTLRITGFNESTDQPVQGVLNLIDLAGSERLSRSDCEGDRLRETQAINKSLSSLGDVISALARKETHVPYRNSKLTYLLQPCLGGNSSKTLMFVNVSPDPSSVGESLNTLRFAEKVNACEIGIPRRQTNHLRTSSDSCLSSPIGRQC